MAFVRPGGIPADPTESAAPDAQAPTDLDAFDAEVAPIDARTARIYLVARLGESTHVIELEAGREVTIGRSPQSTVVVDNGRVSRCHARIVRQDATAFVEDLGSRNATRWNGSPLRSERRALSSGDIIDVGPLELVVAEASPLERLRQAGVQAPPSRPPSESGRGRDAVASNAAEARPEGAALSEGVVIGDQGMVKVYRLARRLATMPTTVLIFGETGVGKELVAEHIHRWSQRATGPFVRLNCASVPDTLLESELFGYERGAFSGADRRKMGYVEAAHGGTLLLDEIGELSLAVQAKLLRALESRRVQRLGDTHEIAVDVRFLCATHRDLGADVEAGRFRRDLFYRVSAFTLRVPSLRERPTEITLLAELFTRELALAAGTPDVCLQPDAVAALRKHGWPGNVRELRNAIEHAVILCEGAPIAPSHLPETVRQSARRSASSSAGTGAIRSELGEVERRRIEEVLDRECGNQTRAAAALGMSRRNLVYKMAKYGIKRS
jgi:DNA-binding NtrC family response regulator